MGRKRTLSGRFANGLADIREGAPAQVAATERSKTPLSATSLILLKPITEDRYRSVQFLLDLESSFRIASVKVPPACAKLPVLAKRVTHGSSKSPRKRG